VIRTTIRRHHGRGHLHPLCRRSEHCCTQPYWLWLRCDACGHRVAVALVPFVIRCGADASSDMLRQQARCMACGQRGASLQHPSWGDAAVGWEVFPVASLP
jgi:DNA-directed RNA polymerase subunit RPC12/RpoP